MAAKGGKADAQGASWEGYSREPVLPVPAFVTADWLRPKLSAPNSVIRVIHEWRGEIAELSGYPGWPERKPTLDEFAALMVDGFRYPLFMRAVNRAARRTTASRRREDYDLFKGFRNQLTQRLGALNGQRYRRDLTDTETLNLLRRHGDGDLAAGVMYFSTLGLGNGARFLAYAEGHTESYADLIPFLRAAGEHLAEEFDLNADAAAARIPGASKPRPGRPAPDPSGIEAGPGDESEPEADLEADLEAGSGGGRGAGSGPGAGPEAEPPVPETATTDDPQADDPQAVDPQAVDPQAVDPRVAENVPGTVTGSGIVADPAGAARDGWRDALLRLSGLASAAADEPDAAALAGIRRAVLDARLALRGWEAARPRLVDAVPLVRAALDLAAALALDVDGRPAAAIVGAGLPFQAPAEAAAALDAEVEAVAALRRGAGEHLARAQAIMLSGDLARFEEIAALKRDGDAGMAAAARALAPLLDRLDALAPARDDVARDGETGIAGDAPASGAADAAARPADGDGVPDAGEAPGGAGIEDASMELAAELAAEDFVTYGAEDPAGAAAEAREVVPEGADAALPEALPEAGSVPEGSGPGFDPDAAGDAPAAEGAVDPLVGRIEAKLVALMGRFEAGLAYHLVRAARLSFPDHDFVFDADELRLLAMAPYLNHAAMQGHDLLSATLERALAAAERSASSDGRLPEDVRQARRLALFGAVSALALFHPDTVAGQLLSSLGGIAPGLDGDLYPLRDALAEATRSRLTLTPAMFRAANARAAEDRYTDECRDEIVAKVDAIGRLQFRFQLGTKIRAALVRGDGALGRLQDAVRQNGAVGLAAAKAFAAAYGERGRILGLLEEAEHAANRRVQGVDGEARERLVANVSELAGLCLAYVQAKEAAPAMEVAGHRALVRNMRASILSGLERALLALSSPPEAAAPVVAAAAAFAGRMLMRLREALDGRLPPVAPYDHLLAVHGALPWVPGLRFGSSWLPAPYEADAIVGSLLQADPAALAPGADAFEAAVRAAVEGDRYVAAAMLVDQGAFRGVGEAALEGMRLLVAANVSTRRDKLAADAAEARRAVDRVRRLGALVGADDGQDLISLLERIDPARIPDFRQPDARTEAEERETILDFAAAQDILDEVGQRVGRLLDKPRGELVARLDGLVAAGTASGEDAARVRGLLGRDDLLTAGEYLDFIADGRGVPAGAAPNPRFAAFFPAVPDFLSGRAVDRAGLRAAMLAGEDVGPLRFSRVAAGRREDAARLYDEWQELARRVQGGLVEAQVLMAMLCAFLDGIGLRPELGKVDAALSSARRKVYAADMRLGLARDAESVLLPEFGSLTGGNYRVVAVARAPSAGEMVQLCANAGAQGVVVLVMEPVSRERRIQVARDAIAAERKALVIDEAILLHALSEPAPRPLTPFELAQPFSFASPYRDYGNQPVPPEIFFGRESEYRKLVEPSGPCIVYGGRRLGKSALLQHVRAREHAPAAGTAVAYVNIIPIGNNAMPSEIWHHASAQLPDVFREPVRGAAEFRAGVVRWLDADGRRRILVLFDEADRFIQADADDGYREFIPLQGLMDATNRRFKFVLAGLHNVTRLVHTENPPLKQIASDPQRIGPLMNEELRDAELLVTRPLGALGYAFENREDVWRILSHCNYYPVLVQTFCKGLLEDLTREAVQGRKALFPITEGHVRHALESERITGEIGRMFEYTIKIDERYELIANLMAERSLRDTAEGRVGEGMSSVEVMEAATLAWPAAFAQHHRLSIVEDLLDEMEGLGVLRRGGDEMWSLRSKAILRLLGNETKVVSRLVEFIDREAPVPFEPRTMRRALRLPALYKVPAGHACPLTLGQEHDLLSTEAGAAHVPVHVVFGNDLSDVGVAAAAMKDFEDAAPAGRRAEVVAKAWPSVEAMLDEARARRPDSGRTLLVVDRRSGWDHAWVAALLRARPVREGRLAAAFVGGPEHALRWVDLPKGAFPAASVRAMPLQLWSGAMVEHHLGRIDAPAAQFRDALLRLTGGFNRPMSQAIGGEAPAHEKADRLQARLERQHERLLADRNLLADLGLSGPMRAVFERMPGWVDDGAVTPYVIADGVLPEALPGILRDFPGATVPDAAKVVEFGTLLGLLSAEPLRAGAAEDARRHALNPLLAEALRAAAAHAHAAE